MKPISLVLQPGQTYFACSCGQSKQFPQCDGSHKAYNAQHGTSFVSMKVTNDTEDDQEYRLCACGHSKDRPFCDGSHRQGAGIRLVAGKEARQDESD